MAVWTDRNARVAANAMLAAAELSNGCALPRSSVADQRLQLVHAAVGPMLSRLNPPW